MKRLILALFCSVVAAQAQSGSWTLTGTGTTTSVSAIEPLTGKSSVYHTLQVATTGSNTVCTVRLEGSLDGTHFWDLSGSQDCAATAASGGNGAMFHVDGKPARYVRASILTWTGGTSAAITYLGAN
jgi:hypothetical protein